MYYDILTKERLEILPLFKSFKKDFYLAGGTALSLQIGHRDSVDFDFFSQKEFNTAELFEEIRKVFLGHDLVKIQDEKNTLSVIIGQNIKISFFSYDYKLIEPLVDDEHFRLASIIDIGCMKLSAIVSRATNKDYVDLYYILKQVSLEKLLKSAEEKMPELDYNLILKSLVYFDDIKEEALIFKHNKQVDLKTVKDFFVQEIKKIALLN